MVKIAEPTNSVISPEEALPRMRNDTPDQLLARQVYGQEVKQRIRLNPKVQDFSSRDTIEIVFRQGGEWQACKIDVRSLTSEENNEILKRNLVEQVNVPRLWDEHTQQYVRDEESPEFMEFIKANAIQMTNMLYDKLLTAFLGEIESTETDEVVWDSNDPACRNREAAIASLRALKFDSEQLREIGKKIDELSIETETRKAEDFRGKF